jgi:alcohol dehydrogenase, propanol-preferring
LITHDIVPVDFDDINDSLDALGRSEIVGRPFIIYD